MPEEPNGRAHEAGLEFPLNADIMEGTRCSYCGHLYQAAAFPSYYDSPLRRWARRIPPWPLVILLALILVVAGAFLFSLHNENTQLQQQNRELQNQADDMQVKVNYLRQNLLRATNTLRKGK